MNISWSEWLKYKNRLAAIDTKAADEMVSWLQTKGGYMNVSQEEISEYAYALATKYGEASAALSAQMYDEVAELSGAAVPAAEVANTATYGEVSNAIKYVTKTITTNKNIGNVVGKYTKQAGVDTTLKNAERDGAQFAWIPSGDSCPYCISLAAKGWQYMSKDAMKGGHASHIHANCDCTYATRFDDKTEVEGYDPKVYQEMYNSAEGNTPTEKINSMRRIQYQANKDKINAQKRANYAEKNKTVISQHKKGDKVNITDVAIDKVKAIGPSQSSTEEKTLLQEMNKQILKISKESNNSNEVAMALSNKTISKPVMGTQNNVKILSDPDMYHLIKGKDTELRSITVSHNHPGLSYFSADDVKLFVDNPTIKTMEVVTNTGQTWYISKKDNYDDVDSFNLFYELVRENQDDPEKVVDLFLKKAHNVVERN